MAATAADFPSLERAKERENIEINKRIKMKNRNLHFLILCEIRNQMLLLSRRVTAAAVRRISKLSIGIVGENIHPN